MASSPPSPTALTAYTCDTLPVPQNIRIARGYRSRSPSPSPTPMFEDSVTSAFDVPTVEEVRDDDKSADPPMSSKFETEPQPPARKLCVRHQRMADEGTNLKLQQVSVLDQGVRSAGRRNAPVYLAHLHHLARAYIRIYSRPSHPVSRCATFGRP